MKDFNTKSILIVSDTHGKTENLQRVFSSRQFDAMIFCGDGEGDEKKFPLMAGCPAEISAVRGNNDFSFGLPFTAVIRAGNLRIFAAHGHTYSLYRGYEKIENAAAEKNCGICVFGHLHKPVLLSTERMLFLNPGSISEPRQEGGIPTCAVMEITDTDLTVKLMNASDLSIMKTLNVSNN